MTTKDTEAHDSAHATGAVGSLVERGVRRLVPKREAAGTRACEHGCNGCEECTDYKDEHEH